MNKKFWIPWVLWAAGYTAIMFLMDNYLPH